jgi:NAD(P)H-nitrite reductase large subunit
MVDESKVFQGDVSVRRTRGGISMNKDIRTKNETSFRLEAGDDMIICRCEEITRGEIRQAVHEGMRTMNEVKRYLRAGMGLCQGQTCGRLVRDIIAKETQVGREHISYPLPRSPVRPVPMGLYANDGVVKK